METIKDAAKNITDRWVWYTASRDQAGIARELADGKYFIMERHELKNTTS